MTIRAATAAVEAAVAAIGAGHAVVVTDAADRENEGDLVFAAEHATAKLVAFTVRHGSGVVCVPMEGHRLDQLALPPMVANNQDPKGTAYAISVDARHGIGTGISATDRARTIMLLADPATVAGDLSRPGHVLPLRARDGGVLEREGHTEAAVDLVKLAGLSPVGVICEIVNDDGTMARGRSLDAFCDQYELLRVSIEDLVSYRRTHRPAESSPRVHMPTPHGDFHAGAHRVGHGPEHLSLSVGNVTVPGPVPVRIHSECVTGDVFGSARCDCRTQLDVALADLAARGHGVLIYIRGHEGHGFGLFDERQEHAVGVNPGHGSSVDARDYFDAAAVLHELGVTSVHLLTNNLGEARNLRRAGIDVVSVVPMRASITVHSDDHFSTKRDWARHHLADLAQSTWHVAG